MSEPTLPPEVNPEQPSATPGIVRVAIVGTFLILAVGAMYYARSFFLPLALAILVTLAFAPLVRTLAHRGIPAAVSAIMLVIALGGGLATASAFLSEPVAQMVSEAPLVVREVRARFAFLREPFARLNAAGREVLALTDGGGGGNGVNDPQRVVVVQGGLLAWAAGTVADIGTTFGATLILSVFLLASGDTLRQKLIRILPDLSGKKRSLRVLRGIENEVSRYLLTIAAINAGLGLCVGIAMAALGMPNPVLWGIAAGLLNFIPYVGPLIGIMLAGAVAIVTYPLLTVVVLPPIAYLTLQIIEGNFVTPMILGRRLELNTVAILILLALTTWMWGIVGTIIGVPLLVVIKVFSDNFPALSPLAEFLTAESHVADDAEPESMGATLHPSPGQLKGEPR
jgi:predicted PurR-regulated permease PerM